MSWRNSVVVAVLGANVGLLTGCCTEQRPKLLIGDTRNLTRDQVVAQLGEPDEHEVLAVAQLLQKDLRDELLAARIHALPQAQVVEFVLWKSNCFTNRSDFAIGIFDPSNGRLIQADGHALWASRTSAS
jgi:hypothetical protein